MIYKKPEAKIVLFDNSDIITSSGCPDGISGWADNNCRFKILVGLSCLLNGYNINNKERKNKNNYSGPSGDPFANM